MLYIHYNKNYRPSEIYLYVWSKSKYLSYTKKQLKISFQTNVEIWDLETQKVKLIVVNFIFWLDILNFNH